MNVIPGAQSLQIGTCRNNLGIYRSEPPCVSMRSPSNRTIRMLTHGGSDPNLLLRDVDAYGCHCLVSHAEVERQTVLSGLQDGALAPALLARLLDRVSHHGFAMAAPPVRR